MRSVAESGGVPFHSRELPLHLRADKGLQENARNWRRAEAQALAQTLQEQSPDQQQQYVVCTAHTSDDQVETVLMKLIRGVYIANIHGVRRLLDVTTISIVASYLMQPRNFLRCKSTKAASSDPCSVCASRS